MIIAAGKRIKKGGFARLWEADDAYLQWNLDQYNGLAYNLSSIAEVAELADARDSKSRTLRVCGFDSHLRHGTIVNRSNFVNFESVLKHISNSIMA